MQHVFDDFYDQMAAAYQMDQTSRTITQRGDLGLLLQFMIAGSFALVLLVLLVFIWPRREGLRRVFASGITGSSGGHDYLPHTGGCNDTGGDSGSGDC